MKREAMPVLVLGGGVTGLGVIRAFGRAGIPRFVIASEPGYLAHSRWHRTLPEAHPVPQPCQLAGFLEKLSLPRAVLMPCEDAWVRAVAALPAPLTERFPASVASPEAIDTLMDKWRFAELLERECVPHPRTVFLRLPGQFEALADPELAGAFLKPRESQEFFRRYGAKASWIRTREQALRVLRNVIADGFNMMLQEYIPGPPTAHYFIDGFVRRDGAVPARFARRRLRMFPLDFGNSTLLISVPLEDVRPAVEMLDRIWAAVSFRGIFSAEFKRDERDGIFKLIEINVRPWWFVDFAARSGVDVCRLAYDDALGLPVTSNSAYRVGTRCAFPYYDLMAFRALRHRTRVRLWPWVRSWVGAYKPVFCWSDPLPGVVAAWRHILGFVRRRVGR